MSAVALRCAEAIRRVGSVVLLVRGEESLPFLASIQPRLSAEEPDAGPLGFGTVSGYTLYTPCDGAGGDLAIGDVVECHGHRYHVQRTEMFRLAGEALYRWAALRKEETG